MTLKKRGAYWYGTSAEDVKPEIVKYSKANHYEATKFASSRCECGNQIFKLESDEEEGVAKRTCGRCGREALMGDSAEFAADAHPEKHICVCDGEQFELVSAVALYEGTSDVRWYYVGCRCANCSLVGVFADWKCEAGDADEFLKKV